VTHQGGGVEETDLAVGASRDGPVEVGREGDLGAWAERGDVPGGQPLLVVEGDQRFTVGGGRDPDVAASGGGVAAGDGLFGE
jgi:hypothetical protein